MFTDRLFVRIAVGGDGGVHRLLRYWALGLGLYAVSLSQLWLQAWVGTAPRREVVWLSAGSMAGAALAYAAIRASTRLGLSAALLNTGQCLYAIACVIAAYGLVGPLRGVTLCILVVVLVFGAFSSTPFQMRAMSLFAIAALGLTMLWKMSSDPARYPPQEEGVHFVLAATMLAAVGYLAGLLSRLRKELKARTLALTDALARINAMASRDELTQLINRRQMVETLARECERRDRTGEALCVAIIDIDHFKRVNDTQGMPLATRCCDALPPRRCLQCGEPTSWRAGAARSFCCCCRARASRRRLACWNACARRCATWLSRASCPHRRSLSRRV